ncbi:MAG: FAD-binding oxidoreductase [Rhodobacteraceae bacterium]|nr:FAD-binding oxidoreductase [Paracoccaceae bacterium]
MTHDFLIIGGGIAGVSAAASLSELGSVCLLEAEDSLGYHATGRSAAMYLKNYGNDQVRALNYASEDHLRTIDGGVLSPRGLLMLASADQAEEFQEEALYWGMDSISMEEAEGLFPILKPQAAQFAGYLEDAPDMDTDRLFQNYLKVARGNGAKIVVKAPAKAFHKSTIWEVETDQGAFQARIVINAGGAWVDEVARLAGVTPLGFQPYRRSIARIPAPDGQDVRAWPMVHGVGDPWFVKPDAGALIVSPLEEDPMEPHDAWADDMVLATGIARYQEMVTEEVTRLDSSWAGLRTFAPDRSLVVGFDPVQRDFFWLGGQGGYGFQTAPAVCVLVAEMIGGQQAALGPEVVAALDPGRFAG